MTKKNLLTYLVGIKNFKKREYKNVTEWLPNLLVETKSCMLCFCLLT